MREVILKEIHKLALANDGQPPGSRLFKQQTGIPEHAWRGLYWARWSDALVEAGFAPNEWNRKLATEVVFQKYTDACRYFGRIPTAPELKMYGRAKEGFPNPKAIYTHFGSKGELLSSFRDWVRDRPDLSDIERMLGPEPDRAKSSGLKEGSVYLIKSGSHYKIGRSDELERRVKEIRIALPETANLVHAIRTDDPAGIEAYWHRRFASRRANGEWFRLTAADIAAFRRRKYQ